MLIDKAHFAFAKCAPFKRLQIAAFKAFAAAVVVQDYEGFILSAGKREGLLPLQKSHSKIGGRQKADCGS